MIGRGQEKKGQTKENKKEEDLPLRYFKSIETQGEKRGDWEGTMEVGGIYVWEDGGRCLKERDREGSEGGEMTMAYRDAASLGKELHAPVRLEDGDY